MDLFEEHEPAMDGADLRPLAERMRPQSWEDFIGQTHIVGPKTILRLAIKKDQIPSMILWGPPGTGKTSLARLIARETTSHFVQLSAVSAGVAQVREIVDVAGKRLKLESKRTILFIDEVHRFSKSQQDAFLPHIENGTIIFIGATTENPSFEVNSALLSRTQIFVLKGLSEEDIVAVLKQAMSDAERGYGKVNISVSDEVISVLAGMANGDARTVLNILEFIVEAKKGKGAVKGKIEISMKDVEKAVQNTHLMYDKKGDQHFDTISAFIKSMRAGAVDAAVYYLARMIEAGEDPKFIARRMVIFASEDIGMAQPTALVVANEVFRAVEIIGLPEAAINLAHGVVYLASSKKDRRAYNALFAAVDDVRKFGNLPIPLALRNAPTKLMKDLGYGKSYERYPEDKSKLLPEKLATKRYF